MWLRSTFEAVETEDRGRLQDPRTGIEAEEEND